MAKGRRRTVTKLETKPSEINWNINTKSIATLGSLTDENVKNILDILKTKYYLEHKELINSSYIGKDLGEVFNWQVSKANEIDTKFADSITYKIVDDEVHVDVNFEVTFLESFTESDIIMWVEGIHKLNKAHSIIAFTKIVEATKAGLVFDEELSKKERVFLTELFKSEKWDVKKID